MNVTQVVQFLQTLCSAYEHFHLTETLANMWTHELTTVDESDMQEAFRRYVMDSQPQYPPTINRLLDLAEKVRQARRGRDGARQRQEVESLTIETVLHHAAERTSERNRVWAKAHVAMFLAGVSKPGRERDAVAWCEQKAREYPEDAADWLREANMYLVANADESDIPF